MCASPFSTEGESRVYYGASCCATASASAEPRRFIATIRPSRSRRNVAGMLWMPFLAASLLDQPLPSKYCGQARPCCLTKPVSASRSWSRLIPMISNPLS